MSIQSSDGFGNYMLLNQLSGKMKILLFRNMFYMILYSYFNIFLSSLQKNQYRLPRKESPSETQL